MAHFYGILQGSRGRATRLGTKKSNLEVTAASWEGSVKVGLWHDMQDGHDYAWVDLRPWRGVGTTRTVFIGRIDGSPNLSDREP